jgi:outer membrane lipoprotein SlyB
MKLVKCLMIAAIIPAFALMSGCAAVGTAVSHASLQTKTMMSQSVFLDPVPDHDKVVYVQVRNTTDQPTFQIQDALSEALSNKGYKVTTSFEKAYYILQVNILSLGKTSQTAAQEMMGSGYGGALEGGVAGALIGGSTGDHAVAGGLIGGVAGMVIDNAVKDVTYAGITDVKITVNTQPKKVFTTRIATTADKVNLSFETAQTGIEAGLVNSISGIF